MSHLAFESLEIRQYRTLRELCISRLGRANLLVGRNNSGKTSVLEALRLYAKPGSPSVLFELLESRDEFQSGSPQKAVARESKHVPVENLFPDRVMEIGVTPPIQIGPAGSESRTLSIRPTWYTMQPDPESGLLHASIVNGSAATFTGARVGLIYERGSVERGSARRFLAIDSVPDLAIAKLSFKRIAESWLDYDLPVSFVGPNGLLSPANGKLWDQIVLTPHEEEVLRAMRVMVPELERLVFRPIDEDSPERVPFAKLTGTAQPVPLRSLGDGVNRLFGIALALVNAKSGLFLIDEVENGIHYSLQPEIWRFIFQVAQQLDVQVFATTHSYDCIKSFEEAARESDEEGVLIRLARKSGRTLVGEFDEADLGAAVEGQVEVR